jgi:hypothetical protein
MGMSLEGWKSFKYVVWRVEEWTIRRRREQGTTVV